MADKKRYRNKKNHKPDGYKAPFPEEVLSESISSLTLREETASLLTGANVLTLGDVLRRCETDFYKICKFNKKNLLDVKAAIKKRNLFLKPLPVKEEPSEVSADRQKPTDNRQQRNKQTQTPDEKTEHSRQKQQVSQKQQTSQAKQQNKHQNQNANQQGKLDKQQRNDKKKSEKDAPYVMTTLIERPARPVKEVVKEESDRYVKINKNGLWGFRDRNSKDMSVPAVYDEVFSFREELCCVQKNEKFGFVNRHGEEIIPVVYDCATSFSEGLACVFKGDVCGYIDKENNVVIDFKFEAGTPVQNGECRVKKNGRWGELHVDNPDEIRWII